MVAVYKWNRGMICEWMIVIYIIILKRISIEWCIVCICHQRKYLEYVKLQIYIGNVVQERKFIMLVRDAEKPENIGLNYIYTKRKDLKVNI